MYNTLYDIGDTVWQVLKFFVILIALWVAIPIIAVFVLPLFLLEYYFPNAHGQEYHYHHKQ